MQTRSLPFLFLAALVSLGAACGRVTQIQQATIHELNLYPEGVVYDAPRSRFLVSSLTRGDIGQVTDDGRYTPFIKDNRLVSAIGLHIDVDRNRLIVCISDPGVAVRTSPATQKKLAGLAVYSLVDGSLLHYANLAEGIDGEHFANDAVVDSHGAIYVTDSFSPVIYKVDENYKSTEFLRNDRFAGQGFNLNGIEVIGDNLIVSKYNEGTLFRIPLANPEAFEAISLAAPLPGADGLLRMDDSTLLVVTNVGGGKDGVHFITSSDGWKTGSETRSVEKPWDFPTTAALRGNEAYVLSARLNRLFGGAGDTPEFAILNASR